MEIKGFISYRYVRTDNIDYEGFSRDYTPVDYQTEATFFLPNDEGKNVLVFQLQYPKYPHNLEVEYPFDWEFYSEIKERNIDSITVFVNTITFLDDNQVIFTGSFANCHTTDEYYDTFNFSAYFKHENIKSIVMASTVYSDTIIDVSLDSSFLKKIKP